MSEQLLWAHWWCFCITHVASSSNFSNCRNPSSLSVDRFNSIIYTICRVLLIAIPSSRLAAKTIQVCGKGLCPAFWFLQSMHVEIQVCLDKVVGTRNWFGHQIKICTFHPKPCTKVKSGCQTSSHCTRPFLSSKDKHVSLVMYFTCSCF